jgi:hypothetical protein
MHKELFLAAWPCVGAWLRGHKALCRRHAWCARRTARALLPCWEAWRQEVWSGRELFLPAPLLQTALQDALQSYGALWVLEQLGGSTHGVLLVYGDETNEQLQELERMHQHRSLAIASWDDV